MNVKDIFRIVLSIVSVVGMCIAGWHVGQWVSTEYRTYKVQQQWDEWEEQHRKKVAAAQPSACELWAHHAFMNQYDPLYGPEHYSGC